MMGQSSIDEFVRIAGAAVLGLACACGAPAREFPVARTGGTAGQGDAVAGGSYSIVLGPMIGAVASNSATVWAKLDGATSARVAYRIVDTWWDTDSDAVSTSAASDDTVQIPLAGLVSDTEYRYQVLVKQPDGHESASEYFYFRTPSWAPSSVTFSVVADFMIHDAASRALTAATTPRADFLAIIGDMDHRDPAVDPSTGQYFGPQDGKKVLKKMRKMRSDMRTWQSPIGHDLIDAVMRSQNEHSPQIPVYDVWDDHDFCGNNADATCPFVAQSLQAWREYFVPAPDNGLGGGCGQQGVWQKLPFGTVATVFLLDSRANRDEAGGSTMLGDCQKKWLLDGLRNAGTTWKIVLSPVTLNPGTKTWDGWGHFPSERDQIVSTIHDQGIKNVIFLSGDIHSGGAIDDGSHSGVPEVSVPHANMPTHWVDTYCHVLRVNGKDTLVSEPGTWTIGGLADPNIGGASHTCLGKSYDSLPVGQLPPPPYPVAGGNHAGYAWVQLTPRSATVRILDENGHGRSGFLADGRSADLVLNLTPR